MTDGEPISPTVAQQQIYEALRDANHNTGLRIHRPPGLAGAYLSGPRVHAYVIAQAGAYQVELWRHHGRDPYQSTPWTDLAAAVHAAFVAATR